MSRFLSTWVGVEDEAHLAVTVAGEPSEAVARLTDGIVADAVASRIAAGDSTLWGPAAQAEASVRLGWVALHETTRGILDDLADAVASARSDGLTRVVLAGMGGSSLGPEVICGTYGVPLVTLDSTDPGQIRDALTGDLASTLLVVSSKSGGTVETDSQRRVFEAAFEAAGLDPRRHIVVVTDPGSPLHEAALDAQYRNVFLADPNVGGRFSVLSSFGVVPAAFAGVPVAELLDEAASVADSLSEDHAANPAIVLGIAMAGTPLRTLVFSDHGSGLVGFADWAEQLIAESTGKDGVGVLPVAAELDAPDATAPGCIDVHVVSLEGDAEAEGNGITTGGTLGAMFLLWEYATSIAGRILGINPFDQPNVESAKVAARSLLDALPEPVAPLFVDEGIEVRAAGDFLGDARTVVAAVAALEAQLEPQGYVAVMAYLNRGRFGTLASVRRSIAARTGRAVTFGWGPRFLHSTGQLHKGGSPTGVFLQITGGFEEDLEIPGRPFTFGQLISAQATGDADVLADHHRPVLRLHLTSAEQVARVADILAG